MQGSKADAQQATPSSFQVGVSFRETLREARQERDLSFTISSGDASRAASVFAPFQTWLS
jgi:hypothetical protein